MSHETFALIEAYYSAFNRRDAGGMLALLDDEVVHEPSQGKPRHGKIAFAEFLAHMDRCYAETVIDPLILTHPDGTRGAAEFQLEGRYLVSDTGLPEAAGQTYRLRVGAFFEVQEGRITRVSNHYNLADWTEQVVGAAA